MGDRVALLVATYDYRDQGLRRLTAPAHDAEALAAVLRDPDIAGFQVTTLINEPHHRVGEAIGDFYRDRRRDDLTLLYFTGHGLKDDEGRLYLAMADTRRDSLLFSALSAEQIDQAMAGCPSRQKVLILDCCYSGAFPAGHVAKADTQVHALERFHGRGRTVLTASDATQYSFEGNTLQGTAPRSVFTRHLVAGLRDGSADLDGDGDITIDELYSYVHDRVVAEMPQQRPKKQDNVEGRMVIARNINWSPPTYLRNALTSPMVAHRAAALDDLAHLYRIGNDVVRARVTTELEHLTNDDSRAVSTAAATLLTNLPTTAPPATPAISATSATSATGEAPPTSAHPAPPEPATPPPVPAEAASPASAEAAPPAPAEVVPLAPVEAARLALTEAAPPALAEDVPPALAEDAPLASPAEPEPPRRTARVARVARPDPAARRARLLPAVAARVRGLRRVPVRGWLAGAAALLLVAAVVVAVVRGYARSWPAEFTYQVGITPLLVGAAVCLLLPRTRRLVGPGLLLGATAAAGWGLVYVVEQLVIDARPSMRNLGDPPAWLMLAGLALAVAAAGWTVLALVRDPAVRLEPRRPRSVRTAVPVAVAAGAAVFSVIGMTGVLRTFANLHVVYLGPVYGIVAHASIVTAALAVAVPVWVAVLVPHALRLSVLGGWAGGALAVGASTLDVTDWTPADHPGELVFAGGALVLLGAAAVAGRRATTRPVPVRRSALLAGLAVLCLLATGGGLTLYRVAAAPVTTAVPWSLAVSPDGHRLYVAGGLSTTGSTAIGSARPGRVWVIDAATRHPVGRAVAVGHGAANVAVSRDGRYAYVSNAGDDSVSVISTPERATVGDPVRVGAQPTSLRLAGSRLLVVNAGSHDVSVLDTTTNEVTGTRIPLGHDPGAVTFTQDGTRAYVASGKQGDIACLDTATGKATCPTMLLGEEVQALAVSPDGTRLYATSISNDGSGVQDHLSIFDTGTGLRRADPIPLDAGPQFSITVSHDGNRVYVPNFFGESISVIDPELGAPVGSPVPVGGAPGAVALSPHDDRIWVTLPSDGKLATFPTTNPTTITTTTITP